MGEEERRCVLEYGMNMVVVDEDIIGDRVVEGSRQVGTRGDFSTQESGEEGKGAALKLLLP